MNLKEALVSGTGCRSCRKSGRPGRRCLRRGVIIPPEMHRLFLLFGCEGAGGLETLADYLAQAKAPQRRVRMAEVLWSGRNGRFPGNRPGRLCRGKMLFRIPWERDVDYTLLRRMIAFNRTEKAHCKTFWRGKA